MISLFPTLVSHSFCSLPFTFFPSRLQSLSCYPSGGELHVPIQSGGPQLDTAGHHHRDVHDRPVPRGLSRRARKLRRLLLRHAQHLRHAGVSEGTCSETNAYRLLVLVLEGIPHLELVFSVVISWVFVNVVRKCVSWGAREILLHLACVSL